MTNLDRRESRKMFLTLAVISIASTGSSLLARLMPPHIILATAAGLLLFHLIVMPLWPNRWTYAPGLRYENIISKFFSFVPPRARRIFHAMQIAGALLLVGFVLYLAFAEVALPLFHHL